MLLRIQAFAIADTGVITYLSRIGKLENTNIISMLLYQDYRLIYIVYYVILIEILPQHNYKFIVISLFQCYAFRTFRHFNFSQFPKKKNKFKTLLHIKEV